MILLTWNDTFWGCILCKSRRTRQLLFLHPIINTFIAEANFGKNNVVHQAVF